MKIVNWTLAGIFALFALVQYNDPDPVLWMILYGSVAVFFGMAATGRTHRLGIWICLIWAVVWAGSLVPEFWGWVKMGSPSIVESMKAEKPYIEFAREFLGLVLAAAGCAWLLARKGGRFT